MYQGIIYKKWKKKKKKKKQIQKQKQKQKQKTTVILLQPFLLVFKPKFSVQCLVLEVVLKWSVV